jgi:hypothetical protein
MVRSLTGCSRQVVSARGPRRDSFASGVLFDDQSEDEFPRKIAAEAWFERREAERYEVQEQTIRTVEGEILTLVVIADDGMLREF